MDYRFLAYMFCSPQLYCLQSLVNCKHFHSFSCVLPHDSLSGSLPVGSILLLPQGVAIENEAEASFHGGERAPVQATQELRKITA